MRFVNTQEGRTAWIHGMIIDSQSMHGSDYPRKKYELGFLVDWIHEDCNLRWGATKEEIAEVVNRFLERQNND